MSTKIREYQGLADDIAANTTAPLELAEQVVDFLVDTGAIHEGLCSHRESDTNAYCPNLAVWSTELCIEHLRGGR